MHRLRADISRVALIAFLVLAGQATAVRAQEPDFIEVLPRGEEARQLELRGDLQIVRKRYLEAIDTYEKALEYDPKNAVLLNKLGMAYHQVLELGDAEKYYKRATKADKNYHPAWNNLGTIYYGKKTYKNAVKSYRRALEINPAQASVRTNLGTALFSLKKYDEAMAQYRLALLIDPEVFDRRGGSGVMFQERSVDDQGRFYFVLAKTYVALGYIAKGLQYLRRALENGMPVEQIRDDPVLADLRDHPDYQALLRNPPVAVR